MLATLNRPTPTPTDDGTRREFLIAGLSLALVVAGCGDDDGGGTTTAGTRVVQTARGPVEVPVRPERVACADFYGSFQTIDLGLTPVGIGGGSSDLEPYRSRLAGVPVVGDYVEPDVEKVASVRPDLILRTIDTEDAVYRQLTNVAPTVEISFQQLSLTQVTTRVADALNRRREGAELVARYEERAADIRAAHEDLLASTRWAMVSAAEDGQFFLYSAAWTDTAVLIAAGVRLAPAGARQSEPATPHSIERLGTIADADVIAYPAAEDGGPDPLMKPLLASSVWRSLPAVRADRSVALPSGTSSIGMAFGLLDALDDALARLG